MFHRDVIYIDVLYIHRKLYTYGRVV